RADPQERLSISDRELSTPVASYPKLTATRKQSQDKLNLVQLEVAEKIYRHVILSLTKKGSADLIS
ncbi:MAG: hypothetical protein WBO19_11040, partial [Terriglobia bacterium]